MSVTQARVEGGWLVKGQTVNLFLWFSDQNIKRQTTYCWCLFVRFVDNSKTIEYHQPHYNCKNVHAFSVSRGLNHIPTCTGCSSLLKCVYVFVFAHPDSRDPAVKTGCLSHAALVVKFTFFLYMSLGKTLKPKLLLKNLHDSSSDICMYAWGNMRPCKMICTTFTLKSAKGVVHLSALFFSTIKGLRRWTAHSLLTN